VIHILCISLFVLFASVRVRVSILLSFNRGKYLMKLLNNRLRKMKFGHTLDDSRKKYPEITDELLEDLQKWAENHGLPKIPEEQLALFAHSCYFNLDATKQCMDVYYRMRTSTPEFFRDRDSRLQYMQHSLRALYVFIVINFLIN